MHVQSLRHLQTSLARIDDLIRVAIARAQSAGHDPTDALRGLVISPDEIKAHLAQTSLAGLWPDDIQSIPLPAISSTEDTDLPFLHLVDTFNLSLLDSYILLLCLAPEVDRRYERLYAYLQDDVTQRRPTVNLVMNLLGGDVPQRFAVWERLKSTMPLRTHHLIECLPDPNQQNPSFLAYHLKVDQRMVAYLLGDNQIDERLKYAVKRDGYEAFSPLAEATIAPIHNALPTAPIIYMQGAKGMGQHETATYLCNPYDLHLITADLAQLIGLEIPFDLAWRLTLREAFLNNAALLLDNWENALDEQRRQPPQALWDALQSYHRPVFLCGKEDWEPLDIHRTRRLLRLSFSIPDYPDRWSVWEQFAQAEGVQVHPQALEELANKFRFTRSQIARSVHTAVDIAQSRNGNVTTHDLYAGAQAHASLQLGHLAKRITPRFSWDNLILPPDQFEQLQEMTARARYTHVVQDDWGFRANIAHVQGVSALFAGESGTGKTLAAEVIANDLGLAMYKIDLSAVVSKYIGETEKNLNTIFTEAHSSNAILFFDEADALFGKRSEVKDARDRYANIEIAYLLQQIESYDGIAVMATNLRQNLDEAFTRRLDFLVDFPHPDSQYRQLIWAAHFPAEAPLSREVNLAEIAERYHLTGGNIRNVAVASAYLAAADGGVITLEHIRNAIRREHQKMGRLLEDNF